MWNYPSICSCVILTHACDVDVTNTALNRHLSHVLNTFFLSLQVFLLLWWHFRWVLLQEKVEYRLLSVTNSENCISLRMPCKCNLWLVRLPELLFNVSRLVPAIFHHRYLSPSGVRVTCEPSSRSLLGLIIETPGMTSKRQWIRFSLIIPCTY